MLGNGIRNPTPSSHFSSISVGGQTNKAARRLSEPDPGALGGGALTCAPCSSCCCCCAFFRRAFFAALRLRLRRARVEWMDAPARAACVALGFPRRSRCLIRGANFRSLGHLERILYGIALCNPRRPGVRQKYPCVPGMLVMGIGLWRPIFSFAVQSPQCQTSRSVLGSAILNPAVRHAWEGSRGRSKETGNSRH